MMVRFIKYFIFTSICVTTAYISPGTATVKIAPPTLSYAASIGTFGSFLTLAPKSLSAGSGSIVSCEAKTSLPAGMTVDNGTCVISGTPSAAIDSASYSIKVTNSHGLSATANVSIRLRKEPDKGWFSSGSVTITLEPVMEPFVVVGNRHAGVGYYFGPAAFYTHGFTDVLGLTTDDKEPQDEAAFNTFVDKSWFLSPSVSATEAKHHTWGLLIIFISKSLSRANQAKWPIRPQAYSAKNPWSQATVKCLNEIARKTIPITLTGPVIITEVATVNTRYDREIYFDVDDPNFSCEIQ